MTFWHLKFSYYLLHTPLFFLSVLVIHDSCFVCKYSIVAASQLMEYAPNSPSIQKRFGTAILHGNKMFRSLEYDWMQIVHILWV